MPRTWLIVALLAVAAPAAAAARTGDANGDGRLTRAEYEASRRALIMKADRDGDGRISPAEWIAGETTLRRDLEAAGYRDKEVDLGTGGYGKMDADKDRYVGAAEIDAYLAARFDALDADHDGTVTQAEMAAVLGSARR
jgi:hypothetical protein